MPFAAIDRIAPAEPFRQIPLQLEQHSSRLPAVVLLLLIATVAGMLIVPFGLVAAFAASQPEMLAVIAAKPMPAVQLTFALMLGTLVVALLIRRLTLRLGRGRTVTIAEGLVRVHERGILRDGRWSAPLAGFAGVAHHVRASLSGTRHEVILVHPEPARSVLLEIGACMKQSRIDDVSRLLGLPEIPARALYRAPKASGSRTGRDFASRAGLATEPFGRVGSHPPALTPLPHHFRSSA
jgi:hypothetical protein